MGVLDGFGGIAGKVVDFTQLDTIVVPDRLKCNFVVRQKNSFEIIYMNTYVLFKMFLRVHYGTLVI